MDSVTQQIYRMVSIRNGQKPVNQSKATLFIEISHIASALLEELTGDNGNDRLQWEREACSPNPDHHLLRSNHCLFWAVNATASF